MDCSLPGFSVHGIFQASVLEWVTISFSRESSQPRYRTWVSHIVGRCFTHWATREVRALTGGLLKSETEPRELSAEFIFHCPSFQHDGPSPALGFLRVLPLPQEFAELGSCCAWPLLRGGCFSQVKPESRHHRCHTSVCSSVLCLVTTKIWSDGHWSPRRLTALRSWIDRVIALRSLMDHVIALRQISVTAQCYSSILFRR